MENMFKQYNKLIKIIFDTNYKNISKFEEILPEDILGTSSYEMESDSIESKPDDIWRIEIFVGDDFDIENIVAILENYSRHADLKIIGTIKKEIIQEKDWVTEYQKNQTPIIIGNFFISNKNRINECSEQNIPICIEASRAFGTGEHETTSGCIIAMESKKELAINSAIDVGTGTGILAFAAEKLWKSAKIYGCDIDKVSINVAKFNAKYNQSNVTFFQNDEQIILPDGAPKSFDLIVSNILVLPLINLVPFFKSISNQNTIMILSGFLKNQSNLIKDKYEQEGFVFDSETHYDNWSTIVFIR